MISKLKKLLSLLWVKVQSWALGVLALAVAGLGIILFFKNKKIKTIESDLAILKAKIEVQALSVKYNSDNASLQALRVEEQKLHDQLNRIEQSLCEKLPKQMTPEELVAKFKEIGTR